MPLLLRFCASTYNRWHNDLTKQRNLVKAQIEHLNKNTTDTHSILIRNIEKLTDMRSVHLSAQKTSQKQELIRTVFDNSLYYQNRIYRTPTSSQSWPTTN